MYNVFFDAGDALCPKIAILWITRSHTYNIMTVSDLFRATLIYYCKIFLRTILTPSLSWNHEKYINSFTISWWWRWCMMCGKKNLTSLAYHSDGISKHTQKKLTLKICFLESEKKNNKILSDKQAALHYFLWLLIPSQKI
jgi:hypothetical protein